MASSKRARDSRYNEPGLVGRLTGQRMPSNVPRNDDGVEDVNVFFGHSPTSAPRGKAPRKQASAKRPVPIASVAAARGPRPDVFHELGQKGRKTGMAFRDVRRLTNGMEDADEFFVSPNASYVRTRLDRSSDRSSDRSRGESAKRMAIDGSDDESEEVDMSLANGSGPSPTRYMHQSPMRSPIDRRTSYRSANSSGRSHHLNGLPSSSPRDRKRKQREPSFESNEDEGLDEDLPPPVSKRDKRQSMRPPSDDEQDQSFAQNYGTAYEEDDQGAMDVRQSDDSEDDEEEEEPYVEVAQSESEASSSRSPPSPVRSGVHKNTKKSSPQKSVDGTPKVIRKKPAKRDFSVESEGVRRSSRPSEKPFAYWRNEKPIYERRRSGMTLVEVVRTEEQLMNLRANRKAKGRSRTRSASTVKEEREKEDDTDVESYEGWDDGTAAEGLTWDFIERTEKQRPIACTSKMIKPKVVAKGAFRFQKVFEESAYMACGILDIPVGSKKPMKRSRDNSYMLYVESGVVQVLVHRTTFPVTKGGLFFVPRGNTYEIDNIGNVPCRLVFAQAREVKVACDPDMLEEDEDYLASPGMEGDTSRYLAPVEEEEEPETDGE